MTPASSLSPFIGVELTSWKARTQPQVTAVFVKVSGCCRGEPQPHPASAGVGKPLQQQTFRRVVKLTLNRHPRGPLFVATARAMASSHRSDNSECRWRCSLSPFHQPVRNGKTDHVYSSSKGFPLRTAIAPKFVVARVVGVIGQRPHNCEARYASDNCLARPQDIMPCWLFHQGIRS